MSGIIVKDAYNFIDYRQGVTFCELGNLDGPYCCGNNNGACCSAGNASSLIVYHNDVRIPADALTTATVGSTSMAALQTGYYSNLHVSTITESSTAAASCTSSSAGATTTTATSLDNGWSSGAKAGLGVGIAVGVIGIAAALAMFLIMGQRQRAAKVAHYAPRQSGRGDGGPDERVGMSTNRYHELHGSRPPATELRG